MPLTRQTARLVHSSAPQIERVPCLSDNYAWLLHEPAAGVTAVVDPAEVAPVVEALRQRGWKLTHVLNSESSGWELGYQSAAALLRGELSASVSAGSGAIWLCRLLPCRAWLLIKPLQPRLCAA